MYAHTCISIREEGFGSTNRGYLLNKIKTQ